MFYSIKLKYFLVFTVISLFLYNSVNAQEIPLPPLPFDTCSANVDAEVIFVGLEDFDKIFLDCNEPFDTDIFIACRVANCMGTDRGMQQRNPRITDIQVIDSLGNEIIIDPLDIEPLMPGFDVPPPPGNIYTTQWNQNLAPGSYEITLSATVCFDDFTPVRTNLPTDTLPCCIVETVTFTLCVRPKVVPTMTEWGLFLFGLIMVNLGLVFVYNRYRQSAIT